jgi:hypothetical protein
VTFCQANVANWPKHKWKLPHIRTLLHAEIVVETVAVVSVVVAQIVH